MKANKLFSGYDSYGRAVDVAQSISGTWFYRSLSRSLYGMTMSAWSKLHEEEINQIDEDGCYPWGFQKLFPVCGSRIRLSF